MVTPAAAPLPLLLLLLLLAPPLLPLLPLLLLASPPPLPLLHAPLETLELPPPPPPQLDAISVASTTGTRHNRRRLTGSLRRSPNRIRTSAAPKAMTPTLLYQVGENAVPLGAATNACASDLASGP